MPLEQFSLNIQVNQETAKQDRIHASFGRWKLLGTTDEIDELRNRMSVPPVHEREDEDASTFDAWGKLFLRPQQHQRHRPPLTVRNMPLSIGNRTMEPPLFSGRWVFSSYARSDEQETQASTHLELWLNPTRYARNQSPVPMPDTAGRGAWPEARMFGRRLFPEIGGETAFDGGDNWLPSSERWTAFTNPLRWPRHLINYLDNIPLLFDEELERYSSVAPGCEIQFRPRLNLRVVETYWEFSSENPTGLVASLEPLLRSFSSGHRETRVYPHELTRTIEHNALTITAQVGPGREIRIYAKTNKRVRVEVIHTLGREKHRLSGGHTAEGFERLPEMLNSLTENAASLVNEAFTHFRSQNNVTPSHISAFQLLLEICNHSRDLPTAITIASLLVHIGTIAAGQTSNVMRRSLHALSAAGILEFLSGGNYVVSESRRHALQTIRQQGSFSLLTERVRRRRII